MNREEYGAKYDDHLLEQYKLYVEMADRVSIRRGQTNRFYVALLSGLFALITIIVGREYFSDLLNIVFGAVGILGIILCFLWLINIHSYRQLNSGKFKVIHEMEEKLPFPCYDREWEILGMQSEEPRPPQEPSLEEKKNKKYLQLTRVEQYIPLVMMIPYAILLAYSLSIFSA